MRKDKRNILIFVIVLIVIVIISYLMFSSGITSKLKANAQGLTAGLDNNVKATDLPVINEVVNSSGSKLVNTDVALIVSASSNHNINKVEYSYDLKNWKEVKEKVDDKEITTKIVFSKTMNKKVYIRVQNNRGYKSYAYYATVNIDKEIPTLRIKKEGNGVVIYAKDNIGLSSVQYSNDKLNWVSQRVSGEEVVLRKENFDYKYTRVVDTVGNISEVKSVK